ncbi:unnamed protein product [Durusdinium trenchii]|uniref:CSD domain-containing protein n=1 Tax=Durusdinium trenchii TaxID=1381693 RepID=A0ABP0R9Y9_9DINO
MAQYKGTIKSFNLDKGYGFIENSETKAIYGKDVFVLKTSLQGLQVPVNAGDEVMFRVIDSVKGPQAENIVVLKSLTANGMGAGGMGGVGGMGGACMGGMNQVPQAGFVSPGGFGPSGFTPAPPAFRPQGPQGPQALQAPRPSQLSGQSPYSGQASSQYVGIVKSFNTQKGWGFITSEQILQSFGKDLFFMKSSLRAPVQEGQQVTFTVVHEATRGPQAQNISLAGGMYGAPLQVGPGFVQSPMQMQSEQYFFGAIKGYNQEKGWGHITCQVAKILFGKEVFVMRSALGDAVVEAGTLVGFKVKQTDRGPQAYEVKAYPPQSYGFEGQPGKRYAGSVKLFKEDKKWGFVTSDEIKSLFDGKDIFLHMQALNDGSVLPTAGDEAHFSIEIGENGKLQAHEVDLIPQQVGFQPVRHPVPSRAGPY